MIPSNVKSLVAVLLVCPLGAIASAPIDQVAGFVPPGWRIESLVEGRLDGPPLKSVAVILTDRKKGTPLEPSNPGNRKLLVFLEEKTGLGLIGAADKALRCSFCYGALAGEDGGTPAIRFEKAFLVIEESGGSRERWSITTRFKFVKASRQLRLASIRSLTSDRLTHDQWVAHSEFKGGYQTTRTTRTIRSATRRTETKRTARPAPSLGAYDFEAFEITN